MPQEMISLIWLGLVVLFAVMEAATVSLVSIWFMLGAVAAMLVSLLVKSVLVQLWVFLLITAVTLLMLRPIVRRYISPKSEAATNLGMLIGKDAIVTEDIVNLSNAGQVKVQGQVWSARSESGLPITAGTVVTVLRVEGVKLYVQPK